MKKQRKIFKKISIAAALLIVIILAVFYIYTLDYYRADADVAEKYSSSEYMLDDTKDMYVFSPSEGTDKNIGLIFYPGGKVEALAYAPLLDAISQQGITCVMVKMPFNLAVFDIKAAERVYDKFPQISSWYLAGHSLGGAMASSYVEEGYAKLDGLILMGAYPINDADIDTLAIYGSEDVNLDLEKLSYTENKHEIAGGNHAYFGNYGEQKGDGNASISRQSQQEQAVDLITDFIANTQE
ncbi:MAG: alpha/beta hydrolase [Eubacteriales bacterium]